MTDPVQVPSAGPSGVPRAMTGQRRIARLVTSLRPVATRPRETQMPVLVQLVRRHPLSAFAILACLFGWLPTDSPSPGSGPTPRTRRSAP